jgi:hypothetical protein
MEREKQNAKRQNAYGMFMYRKQLSIFERSHLFGIIYYNTTLAKEIVCHSMTRLCPAGHTNLLPQISIITF